MGQDWQMARRLIKLFTLYFLILGSSSVFASTRFIATDGGTGSQCDGLTDHALSGATGTNCRLNNPMWVFPARSESTTRAAVAGDTVVIEGSDQAGTGSYRVGCQGATCISSTVNLNNTSFCSAAASYDCYMNTVPNNITVIGCTTSGCGCTPAFDSTTKKWITTCTHPRPEIWGAGNIGQVFSINGASNVTFQDLEITDHGACGYPNPVANCGHGADSTSLSAQDGFDQTNSDTVLYKNLNIHGLSRTGAHGGSVGNHQWDGSTVAYNGSAGVDYDSCNNDGTCGVTNGKYMRYYKSHVIWNGCVENYTGSGAGTLVALACHDQNTSGYGDGVGGTNSSGAWDIQDSEFSHNVSDGLDLLYFNRSGTSGGTITVKRSLFEGNVGDQLKTDNNVIAEDNYIISNCQFFKGQVYSDASISMCRGSGAVVVASNVNSGTTTAKFYNNTVTSNDDVMFIGGSTSSCGGNAFTISAKNNTLMGGADYNGGDATSIFYADCGSSGSATFSEDYNTCTNNFKEASPCPATHSKNNMTTANTFAGTIKQGTVGTQTLSTYYQSTDYVTQLTLKSTSTAIGAADATISGTDAYGYGAQDRGVIWDMGALDYAAASSPVCGNGSIESGEACDDSNALSGDGCSSACAVESGFSCSGTPSSCSTTCGDGIIAGTEQCDDSNTTSGDGCSSTCQSEGVTASVKVKMFGRIKASGGLKFQ